MKKVIAVLIICMMGSACFGITSADLKRIKKAQLSTVLDEFFLRETDIEDKINLAWVAGSQWREDYDARLDQLIILKEIEEGQDSVDKITEITEREIKRINKLDIPPQEEW